MGFLERIGIKSGSECPNLDSLLIELREALPDSESFILRYIAIVIVLFGRVATADGRISEQEDHALRSLLAHIEGLTLENIDSISNALKGKLPLLREYELSVCFRELKALCTLVERKQILKLLFRTATIDGTITAAERTQLDSIAEELGVDMKDIEHVPASI